jgi:signal transduction histidine kinase/CheY-like chemotaxis protein
VDQRVLILAPKGRDSEVIGQLLHDQGRESVVCSDVMSLVGHLETGAGTALITEETLRGSHLQALSDWLSAQPTWSDFPFVLLTARQVNSRSAAAQNILDGLGNVVILERPISAQTLASAVDSALRARIRQYQASKAQSELHASEQALKQLNETLESRIAERTRDLARANDRLVKEIAERERAQAALVHAQKMEAIGQLTNGIAHDFNNLLTAIVGNVDMIGRRATDQRLKHMATHALEAANRATRLTGQLLAFSRTQRLDLKPVALDALVEGMNDLIRRSIGPTIQVRLECGCGVARAMADANQLELAILNMVINARDAMPEGGKLTLTTEIRASSASDIAAGEYIVLSLADTGSGIPPHLLARVFEPFFTTKPIGKGTGLGLSQVYGIAQQSGGTVRITSLVGKGTTVEIWLPVSEVALQQPGRDDRDDSLLNIARGENILLVEDDQDVRRFIAECLNSFGYRVSESKDGYAGLDALAKARPDLLIVDFAMPGINGAELATQARAQHADLPIIFVTGYADMDAVERVTGSNFLLRKPFEVAALANIVRDALSGAAIH